MYFIILYKYQFYYIKIGKKLKTYMQNTHNAIDYEKLLSRILNKINKNSQEPDIKLKPLSSFSNDVYKVEVISSDNSLPNKFYLLKIFRQYLVEFGTKSVQNDVVTTLSKHGQYPQVHVANSKLRLEDFVIGGSPTTENITEAQMLKIMERLSNLVKIFAHYAEQKSEYFRNQRQIFQMFKTFDTVNKQCSQLYPQSYHICKQFTLKILDPPIREHLKTVVPQVMVPTHNDCHFHNVLTSKDGQIYVIDYQFFSPNYRGYELGNFFNEYATDYQTFEIKQQLQMNEKLKESLIQKYYDGIQAKISLQQAKRQVEVGRMLSHLFWLFIGVKQVKDPKITIDMQYYIKRRYQEFLKIYKKL